MPSEAPRPAPRVTPATIPLANSEPFAEVVVTKDEKAIQMAKESKISFLKTELSNAETEENLIEQKIKEALAGDNRGEADLLQLRWDNCIKRQTYYNKWIQETEEGIFEKVDDVKSVVETMVADKEFVKMGKDYMANKEMIKARNREAFETKCTEEYKYEKLGPPPTPSQGSAKSWEMP